MKTSKLTAKYQITIPKEVCDFLMLKAGDNVVFEVVNEEVVIRKAQATDLNDLDDVTSTLSEWSSENDEKAYQKL